MSGAAAAGLGFAAMLGLLALRLPVGLAMLAVGAAGYAGLAGGGVLLNYLDATPWHLFANYTLTTIPLFVLMGAFAERGGLARDLFAAAGALIGHRRGGLAMSALLGCTVFGAVCGSSVATTATMGRAALPELRRLGHAPGFATGMLAVGGTLGVLIPPSVVLVVYAISTEQNIARLFMAALVPGLLAALLYLGVIALLVRRAPARFPAAPRAPAGSVGPALRGVLPVAGILVAVVGGIYGGVFTPTESAAVGCVLTLAVGLARGGLDRAGLAAALLQAAETTGMIFLILLGAEVFNAFLALSGLPELAAEGIAGAGLPAYGVLAGLLLCYVVLGAVMDEMAMLLLTLPVFFPVVTALDFGLPPEEVPIWFGVLVLTVVGMGLTAPPVGLNVFVVSAIARDVPVADTYRGVLPFLAADLLRLALCVTFPVLSLWLVRALAG